MSTSTTQSAHVCTNTYADHLIFVQAAECSRAALTVLKKKWLACKNAAMQDALLLGWRALENQAREEEYCAIQRGHLLHLGVPGATRHAPDDAWRNNLIAHARKVPTC